MNNQKISVLLPVYNNRSTVGVAIQSILDQSHKDFELLVLDDGSTDSSSEVIKQFKDERLQYYLLPHRGLTATLNDGLQKANYDIIARMDADDISHPKRFEIQIQELVTLPKNYFLSSWYGIFTNEKLQYIIETPIESEQIKKGLLLYSYIPHSGLMFYKKVLTDLGGYIHPMDSDAFEDYATWLTYKEKIEFKIIPQVLLLVNYRNDSLSNNIAYKQDVMYKIQEQYYKDLYKHFGIATHLEENRSKGWREYFFGDTLRAREYWFAMGFRIFISPKIMIATMISFLPARQFVIFKESRLRFRLKYFLTYFSRQSRNARALLRSYSKN